MTGDEDRVANPDDPWVMTSAALLSVDIRSLSGFQPIAAIQEQPSLVPIGGFSVLRYALREVGAS